MKTSLCMLTTLAALLWTSGSLAASLETPTLELRQEALEAFAEGDKSDAQAALLDALELAREQDDFYVKANELRYVADSWATIGVPAQAKKAFAESMDAAIKIPTWNHRLYASIGVVEMQRATGDLDGTYANGMKALNTGLLEAVAATGEPAELGRFFTAMDGLLTKMEREKLKQQIKRLGDATFQSKALHALDSIKVKRGV